MEITCFAGHVEKPYEKLIKGRFPQMPGSKYHKQFDPEYKREMVRLVEELGKSPSDVAKDTGVTATYVRRWVKQYGHQGEAAFPSKGNLHPTNEAIWKKDERIKELEEEDAF